MNDCVDIMCEFAYNFELPFKKSNNISANDTGDQRLWFSFTNSSPF